MYRNTRFAELMKGLPRKTFENIVSTHQSDKHNKGFRSWDQLLAMIYAQVSGCNSLRELEAGFNSQSAHHYHLGCQRIKRSTLSDANSNRVSDVFSDACSLLLSQAHRKAKKELKHLLYLIDSTPIPLTGLGYDDWASKEKDNRIQGLKAHVILAPQVSAPVHLDVTVPKVSDLEVGRKTSLEKGATYVFDRGYTDYNWWFTIDQAQSYFVSRFKNNASLVYEKQLPINDKAKDLILEDAVVSFKNKRPGGKRINNYYGTTLRKITVNRPDKETPMVIATNDFNRTAEEIADLYKQRWGIELFFKWIKQNLKIKKFLGRSRNAVKIQIYTALITYLLVRTYHRHTGQINTLKMCLIELRATLFQRIEIELMLDRKRRKLAADYQDVQRVLAL